MGFWHGSGTLGHTITREIVCREWAENDKCDNIFTEDFDTDDYGNVDEKVQCIKCAAEFYYKEESC
jgi:hypothetical protein